MIAPRPRQKWFKSKFFRQTINLIVSLGVTALLTIATYLSSQQSSLALTLVFVLIAALFLWWAINILQNYSEKSEVYGENTENYQKAFSDQIRINQETSQEINQLKTEFSSLINNAGEVLELYIPMRELIRKKPTQQHLIKHFIDKSMHKALCIWNIGHKEFYALAQEGIRDCYKCQLIHHGKIEGLQKHPYLDDLQKTPTKVQRIVVLSKENVADLNDVKKRAKFLDDTGNTPSYWIDEEQFFNISALTDLRQGSNELDSVNVKQPTAPRLSGW